MPTPPRFELLDVVDLAPGQSVGILRDNHRGRKGPAGIGLGFVVSIVDGKILAIGPAVSIPPRRTP